MCHSHAKRLLIIIFIFGSVGLFAQTTTSSGVNSSNPLNGRENDPYSKYGIGELSNGNSTVLKGMGNTTSAFENPYEINSDNPASYSFLALTTYEAGFTASTRTINALGTSYTTGTATLNYLNIGIPVNKNAGLSFGFRPYSHTYYSLVDTPATSPIGQVAQSYSGDGSLTYAYIGGAYRYKDLSIGVNVGYMFGTINNITASVPIDTALINRAYTAEFTNFTRIGGIYWKAGALYEHKIDSDYTVRIGGTLTISQSLTERVNAFQISSYNFGDTLVNDTTSNSGEQRGKLKLPMSYSVGVMLAKNNKWAVALDYAATQWSGFNSSVNTVLNEGIASNSYKISLGGEYTPDVNDIRNYTSRITYRFGLYYGTTYLDINNTAIPVYGFTLGSSLPFRRSPSHLHLSLDVGREGTNTNNLIQETYVRFSLGMSFNQLWFQKRRYE